MKKLTFIILLTISTFSFSQHILEHKYDVSQYILDLEISNSSTLISGNVTINAKVIATSLDTFVVDLINNLSAETYMIVDSIFVNGIINTFQHQNNLIFTPLTTALTQNELFSIQIYYHGNGEASSASYYNGISTASYFGSTHSYSSCESFGSKTWFPSKQVLSDKADSVTFYITTDSTNLTGSLGLLESKTIKPNGKCTYKWVSNYPTTYYLISFSVGPYEEIKSYTQLPNIGDSVLMHNLLIHDSTYYPTHLIALKKTDSLIYLFSEKFGIYPFKDEKYGHCVVGEIWEGMEHQTMSLMGLASLDTTMTEFISIYPNSIDFYCWVNAHELAHHWFGNYVTCDKWNDTWLNEGLGTYSEYIALQELESQARADLWLNKYHNYIKSIPDGSVYVPDVELSPYRNFSLRLSYGKGAAVTHMLRYEINNDSLFFAVLRNYLQAHAFRSATTDDFKQITESSVTSDFTDFFNQWIYGQGFPTFNLSWNQTSDTLTIESHQTTSTSTTTLFKTHFDIKINHSLGDTTIRLFQGNNNEIYKIYCPNLISSIEFDPELWLIAEHNIISVGMNLSNKIDNLRIFPNPTTGEITIDIEGIESIDIINSEGKWIFNGNETEIDLSSEPKGIYIVKVKTNNEVITRKLIKQ